MSPLHEHDAFGCSFDRSPGMILKPSQQCRPILSSAFSAYPPQSRGVVGISGPFWAIIRCRANRETHLEHIRTMNKSSLGHPDTPPVKSQSHGSIQLSTISSLIPYIEPQSGDDTTPD